MSVSIIDRMVRAICTHEGHTWSSWRSCDKGGWRFCSECRLRSTRDRSGQTYEHDED